LGRKKLLLDLPNWTNRYFNGSVYVDIYDIISGGFRSWTGEGAYNIHFCIAIKNYTGTFYLKIKNHFYEG